MSIESPVAFGRCEVRDGRHYFPKGKEPYYREYKNPCGFPADGAILNLNWDPNMDPEKEYISACNVHILQFTEDMGWWNEE